MVNPRARYAADKQLLEKAVATLQEALMQPQNAFIRDAAIQRFEYVFELSWKTMQAAGMLRGISSRSPKDAIRRAFELGWIEDPEPWFKAMDARNLTSHTYDESLAETVFANAQEFPATVQAFLTALQKKEP